MFNVTLASGDTIKLLTDVTCYETLVVVTDLTIDLNGKTLTFDLSSSGSSKAGIEIYGNTLDVLQGGDIKVTGVYPIGVKVINDAEFIMTGFIEVDGLGGVGIFAADDAKVMFDGYITAHMGIQAQNASEVDMGIVLTRSITAKIGISASHSAKVSVKADITAEDIGVESQDTSKVTVNGNIILNKDYAGGVGANDDSEVTVNGNITVNGKEGYGAWAEEGGKITINGELCVTGEDSRYIVLTYHDDGAGVWTEASFGECDITTPTTKAGYLTYTDGVSTVWILDPAGDGSGGDGSGGDGSGGDGSGGDGAGGDDDGGLDTWIIILIAAVVIGAIGALVYFFVLKRQ